MCAVVVVVAVALAYLHTRSRALGRSVEVEVVCSMGRSTGLWRSVGSGATNSRSLLRRRYRSSGALR